MIKSTFKNIGPVQNAELELGDLTIIAGQNNTGKTYLAYTLYGFLSMLHEAVGYSVMRHVVNHSKAHKEIKGIVDKIETTGEASIEDEQFKDLINRMQERFSILFSLSFLSDIFSSPNGEFKNAEFDIQMDIVEEDVYVDTPTHRLFIKFSCEDKKVFFQLIDKENSKLESDGIKKMLYRLLWRAIRNNCLKPFILSAERVGISLFYKELDFTKNRLVEELQNLPNDKTFNPFRFLEKESARYVKPIKDNIDFTRDLAQIQKQKSSFVTDKFHSIDRMMEGYYKAKSNEIRFISKKRGDNRFDIPLHLASSSARGVSDLYFYLKHVATPGQILIIDEPESHLSPTNQMLMARLLVFCVNAGLKVLITTHSDYLIKEINNLIMLNGNFKGKNDFLKKHKKEYVERDCLKPESVKAYICKDGGLEECDVDDRGIDMPIFDDAINTINRISNDLYFLKKSPIEESDD